MALMLLLLLVAPIHSLDVVIKAKNGKYCLSGTWTYNKGTYASCSDIFGDSVGRCATSVSLLGVATEVSECDFATGCTLTTANTKKTCVGFNYKNVTYPASTCIYLDADYSQPWCAIASGIDAFSGGPGQTNWDYCNKNCVAAAAPPVVCTAPTIINYTNPNVDWCTLCPVCCSTSSSRQSPIDIVTVPSLPIVATWATNPITFSTGYFARISGSLVNNGHTMQFAPAAGTLPLLTVSGGPMANKIYQLQQLHFHWDKADNSKGSDHTVNGKSYALEVHFVHFRQDLGTFDIASASTDPDALVVLGFFFTAGSTDSLFLKQFIGMTPPAITVAESPSVPLTKINVGSILSELDPTKYVSYSGSLTTPNCNEIVTWINFLDPNTVSATQLMFLRTLKDEGNNQISNHRPTQPLNGRIIQASTSL